MVKKSLAFALFLGIVFPLPAAADSHLARYEGGIGSQSLRSGTPPDVAAPNVVRGVNPGGLPWVIARLSVDVKVDGRISVEGRGLLRGGGNDIGTATARVHARLFCNGGGAVIGSVHNSADVPSDARGDFRIDGSVTPNPPYPCANPVLLIVNGASGGAGNWFVAGIPK